MCIYGAEGSFSLKPIKNFFAGFKRKPERGDSSPDNVKARPSDGSESGKQFKMLNGPLIGICPVEHGSAFTGSSNTDGALSISDEDKNGKGATADSVQQRRQYRRQNQESSSGG